VDLFISLIIKLLLPSYQDQLKPDGIHPAAAKDSRNKENVNLVISMPITPMIKLKFFGMYAHEIHGFTHLSDWLLQAKYYRGFGGILDNHTILLAFP
jgi:hypothetical protein